MAETLPALTGGPPVDPVWLTAIAKAAAELAAQDAGGRQLSGPITREVVEEIADRVANKVIADLFEDFDVDLDDKAAKRVFREDLGHARKMRAWWGKAGATLAAAIMSTLSLGLIAAVVKYLSIGGGK